MDQSAGTGKDPNFVYSTSLAMVVGDSTMEDFVSSPIIGGTDLGQGESEISSEDIAWADSCLTKDPEISDSYWNSFKDALLETINTDSNSSAHEKEDFPDDIHFSSQTDVSKEAQPNSDNSSNHDEAETVWSRYNMEEVFLPTYNENLRDLGFLNSDLDLVPFQPFELEQSTEDIFRIWDLDIPPEEDDLVVKLNKALTESSLVPTTPVSDDSNAWKDLKDVSLDDLISGIADLSLTPNLI